MTAPEIQMFTSQRVRSSEHKWQNYWLRPSWYDQHDLFLGARHSIMSLYSPALQFEADKYIGLWNPLPATQVCTVTRTDDGCSGTTSRWMSDLQRINTSLLIGGRQMHLVSGVHELATKLFTVDGKIHSVVPAQKLQSICEFSCAEAAAKGRCYAVIWN